MKVFLSLYYFVKKNWLSVFITLIVGLYIFAQVLHLLTPPQKPLQQPNTWESITPNYSTPDDVYKALGQPLKTEKIPEGTQVSYKSAFLAQPNTVVINTQNKVAFVREYVTHAQGGNLQDYVNQFGKYDLVMFDNTTGAADRTYVFLSKGLVVVAHIADGSVEQRWYFSPTDQDTFLKTWGKNLSLQEKPDAL